MDRPVEELESKDVFSEASIVVFQEEGCARVGSGDFEGVEVLELDGRID